MPPAGDAQQEARMRRLLEREGYDQRYGTSDAEIRRNLRIKGRCADFVGYHPGRGMWLIAESKGGNFEGARTQIANTLHGLLAVEPEAIEGVELRIYVNERQYPRLAETRSGLGGYYQRDGLVGFFIDNNIFQFVVIEGIKVQVESERIL